MGDSMRFSNGCQSFFMCWNDVCPKKSRCQFGRCHSLQFLVFDSAALRLGWWCRTRWPRTAITLTDLMTNSRNWCSLKVVNRKEWVALGIGTVKFNTDGGKLEQQELEVYYEIITVRIFLNILGYRIMLLLKLWPLRKRLCYLQNSLVVEAGCRVVAESLVGPTRF
ncbi:hypothetical protein GQ457_08G022420 [Hibiscus cannabinus]